jgi:hypothetical protein
MLIELAEASMVPVLVTGLCWPKIAIVPPLTSAWMVPWLTMGPPLAV